MSNAMTSKMHSKKSSSSRERDKNKSVASESGGSSQCDTPPLTEKDGGSSSTAPGKYPGLGVESVQCMAGQCGAELLPDAAAALAEDVSYKLRQLIHTISLHSSMSKKGRVDGADVSGALQLADSSAVVGACASPYAPLGEEPLCVQSETLVNVTECALTPQTFSYASAPSLTVEWITDERNLATRSHISPQLQNYYTSVAKAVLNLKRKPMALAAEDLRSNPRIGPVVPNLLNLAVLVLNDDNLKALQVPAKRPLQSHALDMVSALCDNRCCLDTSIHQQFQRLFPVMASNILSNGSLSEKMVLVLTKITRTWPAFATMGKDILFDYVSKGPKSAVTGQTIRCVTALGRAALLECLGPALDHIDRQLQLQPRPPMDSMLDAATCLLRPERTTYLEDYVATDYTLYEMIGDSVLPRRTLLTVPESVKPEDPESSEKISEDEFFHPRSFFRSSRVRLLPRVRPHENSIHREAVFEPVRFSSDRLHCRIHIKVKGFRNVPVTRAVSSGGQRWVPPARAALRPPSVTVAAALLNRFRFRLNKCRPFALLEVYMI